MEDVLVSGKSSFKIEVPYKLIETGKEGKKPLIVYLHGFDQNMELFQNQMAELLRFRGYHLFIQGPYPIIDRRNNKKVEDWGRAWYLYDGDPTQFAKSLELGSEFIQGIVDGFLPHIEVNRLCLIGYSMGAYLAGYFSLSRWKHVNELIMIGGRLKAELFEDREHHYDHLNVLALHGSKDRSVEAGPQKKSVNQLKGWGATVIYKELKAGHRLTGGYIREARKWLKTLGY